jgi:hypothetical protein
MLPFSNEVVAKAKSVSLVEYLKSIGEPLVKEGDEYYLKRHDSLKINSVTNLWRWNSREIGGKNAIDYLIKVERKSFVEAVEALTGQYHFVSHIDYSVKYEQTDRHKNFNSPPPAEDNRRAFSYLFKERNILPAVINHFIKCGDLYEDAGHHNAVFVGRDGKRVPRFACKRSTNTLIPRTNAQGEKINTRWDVSGSDKSYGFKYIGKSARLFVFEAPIDLLSFISLREITQPHDTWKQDSYLSLDGVCDEALSGFLSMPKEGEKIKLIVFCLDADEAGQIAAHKLCGAFKDTYRVKIRVPSQGKDFNDMLKAYVAKDKACCK